MTQTKTTFSTEVDVKSILQELGYVRLVDDSSGNWRAPAIYRDGSNRMSLSINKKTGVFYDFGSGTGGSLESLIKLTLNQESIDDFLKQRVIVKVKTALERPKIKMEKIWENSSLDSLLPHYKFYEQRGISKKTLAFLKSGLCHEAEMNMRYAFPIFNRKGQVHGWSGRDITNKHTVKWKHVGAKKNWIYPAFMKDEDGSTPCIESIKKLKSVILVESIGDMMRLWDYGVKNVIVTFGLDISSKMGAFIMSLNVSEVIIATNNDFNSTKNNGKIAALKMFITLTKYVDFEKILIALPFSNDFGDSSDEQIEQWKTRAKKVRREVIHKAVCGYINGLDEKKVTQHIEKIRKVLENECEKYKA